MLVLLSLQPWQGVPQGVAWADDDDDDDDGELFELEGDDDDDDDDDPNSTTVEMGEGPLGAGENPDAVPEFGVVKKGPGKSRKIIGYPVQVALRPLALIEGMFEFTATLPGYVESTQLQTHVTAAYGITNRVQIGVGYGPGTANTDDGFTVGKAFNIEGRYLIFDWLAAQLSVPMYADPFAIGTTIGAPMRFLLGDKAAIVFGQDLLNIRIFRIFPSVFDALGNDAMIAAESTGQILSRGELRLIGGVVYQLKPNLAIMGESGVVAFDFALTDSGVPLRVKLTYSPKDFVDLSARMGFDNLDEANKTFGLTLNAAVRL